MNRLKVAVIRGEALNPWEMQNFQPVNANAEFGIDITACAAADAGYSVDTLQMPVKRFQLKSASFDKWGRAAKLAQRLGIAHRPENHLVGLEEFLKDAKIAHSAETHLPISEQAVRAKQKYGCKIVLTCWETIPHAYEDLPGVADRRRLVHEHVDLYLPTTVRAANALEIEGVELSKISTLYPGVDIERFTPGSRSAAMNHELGVSETDLVFLFIGRLILEKGVRELVIAFSEMLSGLPDELAARCHLRMAGDGPMRGFVDQLIATRKLTHQAKILSGRDYSQLHELHQAADVFILPSVPAPYWEEQFGMVLIEAMSCGKPVISTASGAIPEVVGDAAILVPPMDVLALSQAMCDLAEHVDRRNELSKQARAFAVARYDCQKFASKLAAIYHGLAR